MSEVATRPRRRWPRYSLRMLFVLVTLVGVGLGWLLSQQRLVAQRNAVSSHFDEHDSSLRRIGVWSATKASVSSIRKLFGDAPVGWLLYEPDKDPSGEELRRARELFPEAQIYGWPLHGRPRRGPQLPAGMEHLPDDTPFII